MKRSVDMKKFLVLCLFSVLLISFVAGVVSAADEGLIIEKLGENNWMVKKLPADSWFWKGLGDILGETWAVALSSLIVFLIVGSGIYDILEGFSLFSSKYVKILMGFGIAAIAAMFGVIKRVTVIMFGALAVWGTIGIIIGIAVPIFIFIVMNILFYRMFSALSTQHDITDIAAGAKIAEEGAKALGEVAKGMKSVRQNLK